MRLLFLGDSHGNREWVQIMAQMASERGCDAIVQCGDFGFWEHQTSGKTFLKRVNETLERLGLPLYWVDGNHENFDLLYRRYKVADDGFRPIRSNIFHIPRGHSWVWDDVRFLGLGGAYSVDKEWRVRRHEAGGTKCWWVQELLTDDDVVRAQAVGKVDVMVAHDAPISVRGAIPPNSTWDRNKDIFPPSRANRERLEEVVLATRPSFYFHGHYHWPNAETVAYPNHATHITGLDADPGACTIGGVASYQFFDTRTVREPANANA